MRNICRSAVYIVLVGIEISCETLRWGCHINLSACASKNGWVWSVNAHACWNSSQDLIQILFITKRDSASVFFHFPPLVLKLKSPLSFQNLVKRGSALWLRCLSHLHSSVLQTQKTITGSYSCALEAHESNIYATLKYLYLPALPWFSVHQE